MSNSFLSLKWLKPKYHVMEEVEQSLNPLEIHRFPAVFARNLPFFPDFPMVFMVFPWFSLPVQVQGYLKDVASLSASAGAFAALKCDGHVITWGQEDFGGDSSKVGIPMGKAMGKAGKKPLKWRNPSNKMKQKGEKLHENRKVDKHCKIPMGT